VAVAGQAVSLAVTYLGQNVAWTATIVAHRLTTVQRADEILVLEDGRVREHGDRQALAADPASRFYSLLQTGLCEVAA